MKVFKLSVDLYVYADTAKEAEELIEDELKYLIKLDNQMAAFDYYPNTAVESEE